MCVIPPWAGLIILPFDKVEQFDRKWEKIHILGRICNSLLLVQLIWNSLPTHPPFLLKNLNNESRCTFLHHLLGLEESIKLKSLAEIHTHTHTHTHTRVCAAGRQRRFLVSRVSLSLIYQLSVLCLEFPSQSSAWRENWGQGKISFQVGLDSPGASQVALEVKNSPPSAGDLREEVGSLGGEDALQEGMATHSSVLAWRIPWTEEPGGLQSTGSQRVGHDWVT